MKPCTRWRYKGRHDTQLKIFFEHNPVSENDAAYIKDIIMEVRNTDHITGIIQKIQLEDHEISKIDLSILNLSIYEICFRDDIPFSVSVNEAVELAKKYSSEDAGSFINGILSKLSDVKTGDGSKDGC